MIFPCRLATFFLKFAKSHAVFSITSATVCYFTSTGGIGCRKTLLPPRLVKQRKVQSLQRKARTPMKTKLKRIKPNLDMAGFSLSSALSFLGNFLDGSYDPMLTDSGLEWKAVSSMHLVCIPAEPLHMFLCVLCLVLSCPLRIPRIQMVASKLMPIHIQSTLKGLNRLSEADDESASWNGSFAKQFATLTGLTPAVTLSRIQQHLQDLKTLALSQKSLQNLIHVLDESAVVASACKVMQTLKHLGEISNVEPRQFRLLFALRNFLFLKRHNWIGDVAPVLRPPVVDHFLHRSLRPLLQSVPVCPDWFPGQWAAQWHCAYTFLGCVCPTLGTSCMLRSRGRRLYLRFCDLKSLLPFAFSCDMPTDLEPSFSRMFCQDELRPCSRGPTTCRGHGMYQGQKR